MALPVDFNDIAPKQVGWEGDRPRTDRDQPRNHSTQEVHGLDPSRYRCGLPKLSRIFLNIS